MTCIELLMKTLRLLTILQLVVFSTQATLAESVQEKIRRALAPLESLLASDSSGKSAQQYLVKENIPNRIILQYFYAVGGPPNEYSAAREKRVKEVEQWLAPHEETLIKVLNASQLDGKVLPSPVVLVLDFAAPTERLCDALLAVGRNEHVTGQLAAEAYSTVFLLEMGNEELMNEVIEKIGWRDENHTRAELGMNLLVTASARWARPELKEMYQEFLSVPYKPENYPNRGGKVRLRTYYKLALTGLKPFGKLDDSLVSLLKARFAEMTPEEDRDLFKSFQDTILIAEGECPPVPVTNFKGHLLGVSKEVYPAWVAQHLGDPSPDHVKSITIPPNQATDEKRGHALEHTDSADMASLVRRICNSSTFWIVLGLIAIVSPILYRLTKGRR